MVRVDVRPARVHIFDVDHTLTRSSTGMIFARAGLRSGMVTRRQLATLPFYYLRYRLGRLSLGAVTREIKPLRGYSRGELHALARRAWEEEGRSNVYRSAMEYIGACRSAGAMIVLATSTFDVILEPMLEPLGVDHVLSSVLEFDAEDRSTGWLVRGPCYAEAKAERIMELLRRLEINPETCAFYSDSYHDLPGLNAVGMPVAVNPDTFLRRIAHRRGWPVFRWEKE
ncbi:MAG: HAD-IB family hydrolase [Spirochaetaceae bacterium]|nr:MAG: HAD-IB family hydrolase [Spirochaetaceae bacterium]